MTASLYNIAKAFILQSKYKTNKQTQIIKKKISYLTNNESLIFIQEEINFITYLHDVSLCRWVLECSQFPVPFLIKQPLWLILKGVQHFNYTFSRIFAVIGKYWVTHFLRRKRENNVEHCSMVWQYIIVLSVPPFTFSVHSISTSSFNIHWNWWIRRLRLSMVWTL